MREATMKRRPIILLLTLGALFACASSDPPVDEPIRVGSLVQLDTPYPGVLLVKPDHHMASYDQLMVDPVILTYKRGTKRLSEVETRRLKGYLREATARELVNVAPSKIVGAPGPCVLRMQTSFLELEATPIPQSSGSTTTVVSSYGNVMLVHEMRDSLTGEVLLRYMGRRRAPGGSVVGGASGWRRMARTYDRMLVELQANLVSSVPESYATSGLRAGCEGLIFKTIEEMRPELTSPGQ
jgi:hypothetical protein